MVGVGALSLETGGVTTRWLIIKVADVVREHRSARKLEKLPNKRHHVPSACVGETRAEARYRQLSHRRFYVA
jgi:hypothetical protein